MKPSLSILIFVALFLTLCSATPSSAGASLTSHPHADCASFMSALPHPVLHLRLSGDAVIFRLGYRPACPQTAPVGEPVVLTLSVTRSGRAEFLLLSPCLWLAFPRRSA
jgi:hypothetical protein